MTVTPNPYGEDLGDRNALEAFAQTPEQIRQLVGGWSADRSARSYAPGKWSARQVLIHLAQTELALGTRVRFALTQTDYQAQPFSQEEWLPLDESVDARTALEVYTTVRRLNIAMFRRLTDDQRAITFRHPEYGLLTVNWVLEQMAGHDIHHLKQLETIA